MGIINKQSKNIIDTNNFFLTLLWHGGRRYADAIFGVLATITIGLKGRLQFEIEIVKSFGVSTILSKRDHGIQMSIHIGCIAITLWVYLNK